MLNQIKELLTNAQLQQQIKEAANLAEAVQLIVTAGAEKGYNFASEAISQVLSGLTTIESDELSEADLLAVSGGCGPTYHRVFCDNSETYDYNCN